MRAPSGRQALVLGAGAIIVALWLTGPVQPVVSAQPNVRWYKGNTHTHTLNSDGDSTPDEVARWYRENRYNFLVLTDHNFITSVDGLNAMMGADDKFLIIKGEEVTTRAGEKPIHINAHDPHSFVPPQLGIDVVDTIQRNVDAIRQAKGIPSINHPNFGWAITPEELGQVQRTRLFEIHSGHPQVNGEGGGGLPSLEELWDRVLSSGKLLYGIAVDDAHHFKRPGDPTASGPGRGWVMVRGTELTPRAILDALERGDFYASTGVEIDVLTVASTSLSLRVKQASDSKYRIQFIGKGGKLLQESTSNVGVYQFVGDEGYVRARVLESNGRKAWVQPVPVGPDGPK